METITLKYGTGPTSLTLKVLSVKGFDPVDDLEDFPDIIHKIIDGSLIHQTIGARRHFTIELPAGFMQTYSNRLFIGNFWRNPIKLISYTHDGVVETDLAVVREEGNLTSEWIGGVSLARRTILHLQEKSILTSFPT